MGLLNNKDWSDAYSRAIAKTTVKCSITGVRDVEGKVDETGRRRPDVTYIGLRTEAETKDADGNVLAPGFAFDAGLNTSPNPDNDPKLDTMNRISKERFRELVVAALNLPPDTKDAAQELENAGGSDALKDKQVLVDVAPRNNRTNVNRFSRVPAA